MIALGASKIDVKDVFFGQNVKDKYDLIISIHCKQIFPQEIVNSVTCVNLHPGFNPYNRGWYPQVFSIINKLPIGGTLHIMDAKIDHGHIIAQKQVSIKSSDTSFDLYRRVISAEKELIKENLTLLINQSYKITKPTEEGNYNSISDFKKLCELDLDSIGTLGEHIDLLRALSHKQYKNAYFIDEQNEKVYVNINFSISEQ